MKKISTCCAVVLLMCSVSFAEDAAPQGVTPVTVNAVSINSVVPGNSGVGISGLSFRFLNSKREGYEIPIAFNYTTSGDTDSSGGGVDTNINVGYKFVFQPFSTEFISFNLLAGASVGYGYSFTQYPNHNSTLLNKFGFYPSVVGEIEVPIGKIFGTPADTVRISSGFGLYGRLEYTTTYHNGGYDGGRFLAGASTSSFGTSLTTVSVRYYY